MITVTETTTSGRVVKWTAADRADFCARATDEGRNGPDYTGDPDSDFESVVEWMRDQLASLEIVES
jgi:hypothetical protein